MFIFSFCPIEFLFGNQLFLNAKAEETNTNTTTLLLIFSSVSPYPVGSRANACIADGNAYTDKKGNTRGQRQRIGLVRTTVPTTTPIPFPTFFLNSLYIRLTPLSINVCVVFSLRIAPALSALQLCCCGLFYVVVESFLQEPSSTRIAIQRRCGAGVVTFIFGTRVLCYAPISKRYQNAAAYDLLPKRLGFLFLRIYMFIHFPIDDSSIFFSPNLPNRMEERKSCRVGAEPASAPTGDRLRYDPAVPARLFFILLSNNIWTVQMNTSAFSPCHTDAYAGHRTETSVISSLHSSPSPSSQFGFPFGFPVHLFCRSAEKEMLHYENTLYIFFKIFKKSKTFESHFSRSLLLSNPNLHLWRLGFNRR
eukprot:gene2063-1249_t